MFARRQVVDLPSIENRNYECKERIEHYRRWLAKIDADDKKKERLEACECVLCFESSRIGGCAMTSRQCGLCDATVRCGNTNVDVLCKDCAKEHGLCKHCGADVNLRNRRKRVLPKPTPTKEEL